MKVLKANISKILKSSVIDGPGNRMVIFFQGCNFDCKYCHNSHTIGICNLCGVCVQNCPTGALSISNDELKVNRDKCINCDKCIEICPENSSPFYKQLTVKEVLDEIRKVRDYISGITVSGGECMLQADFLKELFSAIRNDKKLEDLSIFVDSNGNVDINTWEKIIDFIDGAMLDLKAYSKDVHKEITGSNNFKVLKSIEYLDKNKKLEGIRVVFVRGLNDKTEEIDQLSCFLKKLSSNVKIFLIKMRKHGVRKNYEFLESVSDKEIIKIKNIIEIELKRKVIII